MRPARLVVGFVVAAAGCHYAGPLAGGASEIREGTLPSRVARLLRDVGGARPAEAILPATARADSAAIYLVVVEARADLDSRMLADAPPGVRPLPTARVAILRHTASTPRYPEDGWEPVDAFGVYSRRLTPGEYVVFVRDPYHWAARRRVRLQAGAIDTLVAVMRTGMQRTVRVREEPVYLVPYDAAWPRRFEEERARLAGVLHPWLAGPIEHIGSTAVPGLAAKPVIDIMAGVRDLPSSFDARAALQSLEYVYFPYRADVMHWFCKPSPLRRTHHLHLIPVGSTLWAERLAFRDYLRSSPAAAAEYAALKASLAGRYRFDREGYTDAKGAFVYAILERMR